MTPSKFRSFVLLLLSLFFVAFIVVCGVVYYTFTRRKYIRNHREERDIERGIEREERDERTNNIILLDDVATSRDVRVLDDPLYPPLDRTDAVNFDIMDREIRKRNFYVPTNDYGDSYRMVGYLTNGGSVSQERDSAGDVWKLMGRQIDGNNWDFYLIPANNNYNMKIPLRSDIVKGRKIRSIYDIPDQIYFDTPLLSKAPYTFSPLPKSDYTHGYYF